MMVDTPDSNLAGGKVTRVRVMLVSEGELHFGMVRAGKNQYEYGRME